MMKPHISVRDHARLDTAIDALNALSRLSAHYRYHQPIFEPADITMSISFGDVAPLLDMIDDHLVAALIFNAEGE